MAGYYYLILSIKEIIAFSFGGFGYLSYLCSQRVGGAASKRLVMTDEKKERYINPYTDFGFKKLFGTEMNKDLLISFLNAVLANKEQEIEDVQYLNTENLGDGYGDRRSVFDVYCKTVTGSRFIVEMQKAEQSYFKDRSIYYSTFAIRERLRVGELCSGMQGVKGKSWNYRLDDVYTVGVLNFIFPGDEYPADKYRHEIKLKDVEDNHVFYDKLTFVYLEMPKFSKTEDELETMFDKWMFVLRNLSLLLDRPKALQDRVFEKLFRQAEIARYTPEERRQYEASVKEYWDYTSIMDTAYMKGEKKGLEKGLEQGRAEGRAEGREEGREEGRAEGREEGRAEEKLTMASRMKADGLPIEAIAKYTGLTIGEISKL